MFHTIQYVVLQKDDICLYYQAYQRALIKKLYRPVFLEPVDVPREPAEPVPTSQADEYYAMAMLRWFGISSGFPGEYNVPGGSASRSARQALFDTDPNAYCLLRLLFKPEVAPLQAAGAMPTSDNRTTESATAAHVCAAALTSMRISCALATK